MLCRTVNGGRIIVIVFKLLGYAFQILFFHNPDIAGVRRGSCLIGSPALRI